MYLQTLNRLVENCGESMCYFNAMMYHANQLLRKSYTVDQAISHFADCVDKEILTEEGFVNSLWDLASSFGFIVLDARIEEADYVAKDDEFEILNYVWKSKRTGIVYIHFVAARNGVIIYDPMGFNSNVVKNGYLHSKRIVKIKL